MEQVVAIVGSAVLGLALVAKYLKYVKQAGKYVALAGQSVKMVDDFIKALHDGKLTEDEVKGIAASYAAVKLAYQETKK